MWFRSLSDLFSASRSKKRCRKARGADDRRRKARALLFESLDPRRVMAFSPFSDVASVNGNASLEVTRDFSGDGQADLVVSNGSAVQVFVATGGGNFGAPVSVALSGVSVAAGDLNGDSKLDLVSGSAFALGNGDGTFQAPTAISLPAMIPWGYDSPVAQTPGSVAVGDINGDGKLDLAVTGRTWASVYTGSGYYGPYYNTYTSGHVNVLLGNGDGTLQAAIVSDFSQQYWNDSAALAQLSDDDGDGDVDNDDNLDLIVKGRDSWSAGYVLRGQGNGSFAPAAYIPTYSPDRVVLGDMDDDGFLDLLSPTNTDVRLSRGLADGTFAPAISIPLGGPPSIPRSVAVGDINGDGKLDISVVTTRVFIQGYGYYDNPYPYYGSVFGTIHDAVKVILGNGDGTFSAPVTSALGTHDGWTYAGAHSSLLGDVNGDGRLDVAVLDRSQGMLTVALNDGLWAPPAAISIGDVEVVEGASGQQFAVFTVTATGDHSGITVDFLTQDYTATAGQDYTATSGTLTFAAGVSTQTISVAILDDNRGEWSEVFFVQLLNSSGATLLDDRATGLIVDNEPTVSINHVYGVDPLTVVEGDGVTVPAEFTVTLSAPYNEEITVDYYTSTGHTNDIISASGTLRFAPGDTSETITIQVVGDLIDESLEAFNVYLTNSPKALIVSGAGYCYIEDNDPGPTMTIGDASKREGNKGTTRFDFTVQLSTPASNWISVSYATVAGTATAGQDYVSESGTLWFSPGQTTATISIDVVGDRVKELEESFFVNLSNASGADIADAQGQGTIQDDDTRGGKGNGPKGEQSSSFTTTDAIDWLASSFTTKRRT